MEEVTVLIKKAQSGDKKAREVLIENNLGLVHHIVKRFLGRGYDAEDLFQIGSIGLIKAIDKFNLDYDVRFSTYAVPMITGEIKRFLRDDGMVKVSRTLKENGWKIRQASAQLAHTLGREPTLSEIEKETGIAMEDIVMAMEANVEVESIYKSVYQSDGSEIYLLDQVAGMSGGGIGRMGTAGLDNSGGHNYAGACEDYEKEKVLNHMLLTQVMDSLEENERELIYLRYFQDQTQTEVAKRMGVSQVQVSRMEKKILVRLRKTFA